MVAGSSQAPEKIFDSDAGLFQRSAKGSDGQNRMAGYNAAILAFLKNHMAASLPDLCESKAFQSANSFVSGNLPQPRHSLDTLGLKGGQECRRAVLQRKLFEIQFRGLL